MTELVALLQSRTILALGWGVIHSAWQVTLIAAVAAVALRGLRRSSAATRYAVLYMALLSAPAAWGLTLVQSLHAQAFHAALPLVPVFGQLALLAPWVGAVWLIGLVVTAVHAAGGGMRIAALRSSGTTASPLWQERLKTVAARMGVNRIVRVVESSDLEVPGVIGCLSPVILFPASVLSGLSTDQIELILAHELAHVRRHDYVMNLIQTGVEALFFFHPALWWMSARLRVEREQACDDLVVERGGDAVAYALALTEVEQLRGPGLAVPAVAASGGHLLERIRRLTALCERPRSTMSTRLIVSHFLVFSVIAISVASASAAPVAAAASLSATLWLGTMVGLVLGMRHALEPDHLVAVSTMVTEERGAFRAARLGMSWGLGHTLTLVLVGTSLALIRVSVPERVANGLEMIVAVMLIGLGVRALRTAWRLGSSGLATMHAHGSMIHHHRGSADHFHIGSLAISRRPLMVGMVHGLAGSGALAALVMASLPTVGSQIAYIVVFGLGSTLGMAVLSGCVGVPLSRLAQRPGTLAWISAAAGTLSVVAGFVWGGPLVWQLL